MKINCKTVFSASILPVVSLLLCGSTQLFAQSTPTKIYPASPFLSPASGTYSTGRTVSISDATPGAVIYYTTDGSAPTTASAQYMGPITIPTGAITETIRAFAVKGGLYGSASSATYTIKPQVATPSFSLAQGSYMTAQQVSLSTSQPSGVIHYTTDGSVPTEQAPVFTGTPIKITQATTVTAIVGAVAGYAQSAFVRQTYNIVPTSPYISPASGTYTVARTVSITDNTPGAVIYYTTDGSAPTPASPKYVGPFSTPATAATEVVRAFAVLNGVFGSSVTSTYTIAPQLPAATPAITPSTGSYSKNTPVVISAQSTATTIYYTLDGTTPTSHSTQYTAPFVLPSTATTTIVKAVAYQSGCLPSAVAQSTIELSLPAGVIATAIVNQAASATTIPTDFLGFSHEWGVAQTIMGQKSTGTNTIYRQLVNTLTAAMGGTLVVRVATTDRSATVDSSMMEPFAELAAASDVKFIIGVNLGNNDLQLAENQAKVVTAGLPKSALMALEVGNEPDGYTSNGLRDSSYSFSNFLPEFREWVAGISSMSIAPIAGPTLGTGSWIPAAQSAVTNGLIDPSIITQHKYLACYYASNPLPSDLLLQPGSATASKWLLQPYVAAAHQMNKPFRMAEMNSVCLGGQPGLSDSFSSALWSIDTMFEDASIGIDGVNWHTNADGGVYDLFHFDTWKNSYVLKGVNPLYYGLLFFAESAGKNAQLIAPSVVSKGNVKIWITKDQAGHAHLVVINKEQTLQGNVQITMPGYQTGSVTKLTGSSYLATTGISIAGQTFDGSPDGQLQGTANRDTITPSDDVWTIPVGAMSAIAVDLQPTQANIK